MSIEIFEKAVQHSGHFDTQTFVDLLHDAGFADVELDGQVTNSWQNIKSASGVYGVTSFQIYGGSSPNLNSLTKLIAVKDDSRKSLIVFCNAILTNTNNASTGNEWIYFSLIIVDGASVSGSNSLFTNCGMTGGSIKNTTDTSEAKLVPFMDSDGNTHEPFYVAMNRVNYPINTVVTDGTNSFTSLGNLFYIKNN